MERDLWTRMMRALRRLPRTRPRNAVYTDAQVVAVLVWAALHERPVSWACQRGNWPVQAWRRKLPDQSTMSRRLRHCAILELLVTLLRSVQGDGPVGLVLVADGKPLELSEYTRDPDAKVGRGAGRMSKGYKVHVIIDPAAERVVGYQTLPLNKAEPTTAAAMMKHIEIPEGGLLLADALFDSNPLHRATHARGCQLVAPRKKPGTGLGSRRHHPGRFRSIELTEGKDRRVWDEVLQPRRAAIERFFGAWVSFGGGLSALPPWVRRLHRVRVWVGAKLVINAARIANRKDRIAA